jgi:glycosyltransferase involved in cell wall biosynthesis
MNILWNGTIQGLLPDSGVSRYCADALSALAANPQHRQLTYCPPGAPAFKASGPQLRQIRALPFTWLNNQRIKHFNPDILQASYYADLPQSSCPVVQIAYDFIDIRFPIFMSNKPGFVTRQRRSLEQADAVIAISDCTRQDILKFTDVPEDRIHLIYPALSSAIVDESPLPSRESTAPYFLWVGKGSGYKNRFTFLKAFARAFADSDMQVVVAGGANAKFSGMEIELLLSARLLNRVHFQPSVTDQTLRELYTHAEAFVQSSLWEGFGIPVIEAMSCGCRTVLSDIPVFHEVAGPSGIYADPYDVDAWAAALKQCAGTPQPESGKETLRRRIREKFHSRNLSDQWLQVYQQLV